MTFLPVPAWIVRLWPNFALDARYAATLAVLVAAYVGFAKIGFALAFATKQVTAVWPPAGIAVAAFLLMGGRAWPGVWLGAFIGNAMSDEPMLTAAGIATGNTLGPLFGAVLLRRLVAFDNGLARLRDVLGLVGLGACLAMCVTATNGVLNLAASGIIPWSAFASVWWVWWAGDAMGVLLVAPVVLTWASKPAVAWRRMRLAELTALLLALLIAASFSFTISLPLAYPVFPFIIWMALRFEQRETASAIILVSAIAIWGTIHDLGPFASGSLDQRLILLTTFMAVLAVTGLVLGAITAERRRAEESLERARDQLEVHVRHRTAELAEANAGLVAANRALSVRTAELAGKNDEVEEARHQAEQARIVAESASQAKSEFLTRMSHELRTPLNAIMGFAQLFQLGRGGKLSATQQEFSDQICSSGQYLLRIIDEMLDMSAIEAGRMKISVARVSAAGALESVRSSMATIAADKGVAVTVEPIPASLHVRADEFRLRQILTNLLSNAIKYNRQGGSVTLAARAMTDDSARFSVADTGNGIDPVHHPYIFEPFNRAGSEYSTIEGTGLGLSLAKRLAELMEGRIAFVSTPSMGSTFWVDLPVDPEHEPAVEGGSEAAIRPVAMTGS